MDSTLLILWLIVAVIAITYYLVSNANSDFEEDEDEQEKFPAVIIVFDEAEACPSVKELAGRRLLSTEAPLLPLIDCTCRECTCTYRHYVDRRGRSRRIDEKSVVKRRFGGDEKRVKQRGRRAADIMEDTFEQTQEEVFDTHADTYYDFVDRTGLFKAMAAKEAEESALGSSEEDSSDKGSTDRDSSEQASSDHDAAEKDRVATFAPASIRHDETASPDEKKSGQSRS
jgi:hypothetical protein